jgi:hypothetical protein
MERSSLPLNSGSPILIVGTALVLFLLLAFLIYRIMVRIMENKEF